MAKLERIRTGSTGSLTPKERESLHELVKEYNSDFRVQASLVPFVGDIQPESGAIVVSDHDGRMYYADEYGWHLEGSGYSPILLFVDFDGTTQFDFKFKAPSTSTITLNWGDGTTTEVAGQDDTLVTESSAYASAGVYSFYVTGDVSEFTSIAIIQAFISGSVNKWSDLHLTQGVTMYHAAMSGDLNLMASDSLEHQVAMQNISDVSCDVNNFPNVTLITIFNCPKVGGDLSQHSAVAGDENIYCSGTIVTWDTIDSVLLGASLTLRDNLWTSTMVDNCLISLSEGGTTGKTINIGGNNAARTSASDAALITLEAAGNTIFVNE